MYCIIHIIYVILYVNVNHSLTTTMASRVRATTLHQYNTTGTIYYACRTCYSVQESIIDMANCDVVRCW